MSSLAQVAWAVAPAFALSPKGYREMINLPRYKHLSMVGVWPALLAKDQLKWNELANVTELINRSAIYVVDEPGKDVWGPWRLVNGLRAGDCDDYAVHKLQRLVAMDYPRGALRLAVCQAGKGYHCVLLIYLSDGDAIIMDNRTDGLWRKSRRPGYKWVSEEWPGQGFWWRKLT